MKKFYLLTLSIIAFLIIFSPRIYCQEKDESLKSLSAILDQMQDLWVMYQQVSGSPDRASNVAQELMDLHYKTGMRSQSALARAFALIGWRHQQEAKYDSALKEMTIATQLDPFSRELKVALANTKASRDPFNFLAYFPILIDAMTKSFSTMEGRYELMTDSSLWVGVTFFIFGLAWALSMLFRYFRNLHHTLSEILSGPFGRDFSPILAAFVIGSPIALAVPIHLFLLGLFVATWGFQSKSEKFISFLGIVFLWVGAALIALSADMATGLTDPVTQAGFAAERMDSDFSLVNSLEKELLSSEAIVDGHLSSVLSSNQRRDLFLYATSLRKIGRESGEGIDVLSMFSQLIDSDSLGMRARVNAANIKLERGDFVAAVAEYEDASKDSTAQPFALYNLWRFYFKAGDVKKMGEYWDQLSSMHPHFIEQLHLNDEKFQPILLDASLTDAEINQMVFYGLARANNESIRLVYPHEILVQKLISENSVWVISGIIGMIFSAIFFGTYGTSVTCKECGKVFCHSCDADPKTTRLCQACNVVKSQKRTTDKALRTRQLLKISQYQRRKLIKRFAGNFLIPGFSSAAYGNTWVGSALLFFWSLLAGFIYSLDRMPRAESLPFYSHWTALSWLLIIVMVIAIYTYSILLSVTPVEEKKKYGTDR